MIVVTNTIRIKSGFGEQVAERFKNPKGVHLMPGFEGMELLLSRDEEADELKVVTHWQDKSSFDNWVNSDSFKQAHARPAAPPVQDGQAQADPVQPMGGTATDGNPVAGETAAEASGSVQQHGGSAPAPGAHAGSQPGAPNPRELMLGAKLSVHEVLFTLGADKL
ncbi:antibiotic biosynthesis monooxygenase [Paenibacillus pasadenensis]|uniref:antibiotic biosynthesis monooxygenase n=1 Tax=Paenibacillus pasadenensis TaxID=217090 RepID=UPI00203C404A|nr:antibiotic biosynthesis monooxygenase [Paenibacillus pasadenensis]MCM3750180.1 antibiotic biosynthesis monooxygenase [Paenibacillus pasadenensis]